MRRVLDEWLAPFRWPGIYLAWFALSLVAALLGPFGTYLLLDLPQRIAFWAVAAGITLVAAALARAVVRRIPGIAGTRWSGLSVAVLMSLGLTPLLTAMTGRAIGAVASVHVTAEIAATLFFATLAACALSARDRQPVPVAGLGGAPPVPGQPLPAPVEDPVEPRLLRRLDPGVRGRLVSISVRDHYVDVATDRGRASLLMRLSDAVAETEGEEGVQIHRSHWVARHAGRSLVRNGARVLLVLADGSTLPVSRTQRPQLDDWNLAEADSGAPPNTTP